MEEEPQNAVVLEPLIDSRNPPVVADNVLLALSKTGAIRVMGFSGTPFIIKEEEIDTEAGKVKRRWIRPTCVVDFSQGAVEYVEAYLLLRLSESPNDLENVLKRSPGLAEKLRSILKDMEGNHRVADS